jgi:DNA-3-methyladenine glycosylase
VSEEFEMTSGQALTRDFYRRNTKLVARDLLGKILIRRLHGEALGGILVETEAYYGTQDPASRAYRGRKRYNEIMWGEVGRAFIYNVHNSWLFNVVAHKPGEIGAILIRALEPTMGVDVMKVNRPVENLREMTSGPGKLTRALKIDKSLNGVDLTIENGEVRIVNNELEFEVVSTHRIGVTRDLENELRFIIRGNRFVSR